MQHFINHTKDADGNGYMHFRGVGTFQVPEGVQAGLNEATDEWLLDNLEQNGFIQPFVMGEIMARGIYWKVVQRKEANRPKFSFQKFFEDLATETA